MTGRLSQRSILIGAALGIVMLAIAGIVVRAVWPGLLAAGEGVEVRLPPDRVFAVGGVPVTNTLLSEWLGMLFIAALFAAARWGPRRATRLLRTLIDSLLTALLTFVQGAAGERAARWLFPIAATMMILIAANAVVGMLPVYDAVFAITTDGARLPLLKSAGTDVNFSIALAVVSAITIEISGLHVIGRSYLLRFLPLGNLLRGRVARGAVDLFIGGLECAMEFFRMVALTVRLFGSITAAEILIAAVTFLAPVALGLPFQGLELLIAAVQAWIFGGLTVLFAANAMTKRQSPAMEEADA